MKSFPHISNKFSIFIWIPAPLIFLFATILAIKPSAKSANNYGNHMFPFHANPHTHKCDRDGGPSLDPASVMGGH